ncbi:cytochrome P450 [Archangium minus]|uniref:Cytochrome P450 n=1 Tax=Archangium minus TaxID=83450 RepID=A0ABY9WIW4_9BACT|nr:cytochrome P450 [Archangium minus]
MTLPQSPVAAVTHPEPYPYYARLVTDRPLYHDPELGLWVASSAEAVMAVLSHDACRVRPVLEPVPRALLGSSAADIFRHLVRMNDGASHCPLKQAVSATLGTVDEARALELGRKWARRLFEELAPAALPGGLTDFAFRLSVHGVGELLGVPEAHLPRVADWMSDFVRCLAPASSPEQVERGRVAAGQLLGLFREWLSARSILPEESLLSVLARELGHRSGGQDVGDAVAANGIGLMSQAYEAGAGLFGNTLRALACLPEWRERVSSDPGLLGNVMREVLRYDPPIQNTRRFVVRDDVVAGEQMKAGDVILVVLAAANRDPRVHPNPERFDPFRPDRETLSFGTGVHACPGEVLALAFARAGVERVLMSRAPFESLTGAVTYRTSANARIPLFETGSARL